ncbi:MAG: lipopolysaccharide biosynthesis protein, partial [Rhizobiaceae bacterium]|nr:lipopolysaccharide biosynthesis protein [Rhizobiaceae bacterium]
ELLASIKVRAAIEGAVFVVSTASLAALALVLHFFPNALGSNVSEAAPLVMLALMVPGLRNLTEYQAELLFARGRTGMRAVILAIVGALKVGLLYLALGWMTSTSQLVLTLNAVFLALYVVSAVLTYTALRQPAKTF